MYDSHVPPELREYARVEMYPAKYPEIKVYWLGFGWEGRDQIYFSVDHLPNWIRERLAVLAMESFEPPTEDIAGVGRRISEWVYWVEAPDKQELASNNTRKN